MIQPIRIVIYRINIVRPVCNHLVGKKHNFGHRLITGVAVMIAGVLIAKEVGHSHNEIIAMVGDTVGYGLHGLGLTPIVEAMIGEYEG